MPLYEGVFRRNLRLPFLDLDDFENMDLDVIRQIQVDRWEDYCKPVTNLTPTRVNRIRNATVHEKYL